MPALLEARNLVKSYDNGRVRALDHVDLVLERGEFVSIVGPSGSGKSTLLHMLGALDRPDEGSVVLDGVDLTREKRLDRIRAKSLGFVFQLHNLVPTLTAEENVELPMVGVGVPRPDRRTRAGELLELVGLHGRSTHIPSKLSGGQRQRVAIARALANDPPLLLADEPTGDLDQASGRQVMELLEGLRRDRGLTLVLVTHDLELAKRADRTIRILDGKIAAEVPRGSDG
ncbi:MAG: ABC transporter ATP-binding protein [Planctomycetota bacterium]